MHFPSTMSGDDAVKNAGWDSVSFRHATLPVAASRQETAPQTPSVQILPSATAGVLRGPGCALAEAPVTAFAVCLSFHSTVPLPASRHETTSSLPCRVKAYTLSPTSTGDASPSPTV